MRLGPQFEYQLNLGTLTPLGEGQGLAEDRLPNLPLNLVLVLGIEVSGVTKSVHATHSNCGPGLREFLASLRGSSLPNQSLSLRCG